MRTDHIERAFEGMGARVKIVEAIRPRRGRPAALSIDVAQNKKGAWFEIRVRNDLEPEFVVEDVQRKDRHLLLMVKTRGEAAKELGGPLHKFLCGHDERTWFVAAVPEDAGASTVLTAKEALKPPTARGAQERSQIKSKNRNRRRNPGFVRQGEWFFVPEPRLTVDESLVLHSEPLQRGAGKPHVAEFLFRRGGTTVYVSQKHPGGVTESQYRQILRSNPDTRNLDWRLMARDSEVYVMGRISHPDHKTVVLPTWHRVQPNTEAQAADMRHVAFLD